jgi:hypothetical protein
MNIQRHGVIVRMADFPEVERLIAEDDSEPSLIEFFQVPFYWGFFEKKIADGSYSHQHEAIKALLVRRLTLNGDDAEEITRIVAFAEETASSEEWIFEEIAEFGRQSAVDPISTSGALTAFLALNAKKKFGGS